jgi:hypothetical protein
LDGNTFTLTSIATTNNNTGAVFGPNNGTGGCVAGNNSGNYFNVTGTGIALDSALMYYYPAPASAPCNTGPWGATGRTGQAPNFSSATGGTANIVMNESYTRGINVMSFESELGNAVPFFVFSFHMLQAVAQHRIYYGAIAENAGAGGGFNSNFNDGGAQTFQSPTHPRYKFDETQGNWQANSVGALFWGRFTSCIYQPRGSAPDLGQFFETTLRLSSVCNMIGWASMAHGSLTRVVDLTPIAIGGQPIWKYCASAYGIAPPVMIGVGVTSDMLTTNPDTCQSGVYVASPTTWLSEPVTGINLSDCPSGTASMSYQIAYSPLQFYTPQVDNRMLFATVNAGSGTSFQLPVDPAIGPAAYIRPVCVLSAAAPVVGDIQELQ